MDMDYTTDLEITAMDRSHARHQPVIADGWLIVGNAAVRVTDIASVTREVVSTDGGTHTVCVFRTSAEHEEVITTRAVLNKYFELADFEQVLALLAPSLAAVRERRAAEIAAARA